MNHIGNCFCGAVEIEVSGAPETMPWGRDSGRHIAQARALGAQASLPACPPTMQAGMPALPGPGGSLCPSRPCKARRPAA